MRKFLSFLLVLLFFSSNGFSQNLFTESFDVGYSGNFYTSCGTSNLGLTYTCVASNRVGLINTSGSNYLTTNTLYVPQGSAVNLTFKLNKYSGYSGPVEVYFLVNEASSFSTTTTSNNGWAKFSSNATTFSCGTNTFNLPSNIVGGQKLSFTINFRNASATNWVAIEDMSVDAVAGGAVPTTYTENFTTNAWYPNAGYVSIPYHSYATAANGYTWLWSGGVGGAFDYCAAFYTGFDFVEGGSTNIITREINTSGYTHGELRYAFKSLYPCGGPASYTFDEDYTNYAPNAYIMTGPYDGSATWTQLPVNYYFADNTWRYASYDISAYNNANIKVKFERGAFCSNPCEAVDNLKIFDRDCSISLLACGPISGPSSFSPSTDYSFSVAAVTGATYYKWFVRDGGTLYSGAPSGGLPGIVSGQGTLNAVINFGSTPGDYRVLCIPYDTDPTSQPDACYAKIAYFTVSTSSCTPPLVTTEPVSQTVCVGNPVTFSTVSSGTIPLTYQWQLNGSDISGATDDSYFISSPSALDVGNYTCIITNACGDDTTAQASLTVNNYEIVGVSIAANPGTTVCSGTSVTFTATPTYGGSSPTYQWQLNGSNVGTGGTTYTNAALANGDLVTCIMTSDYACPTGNPATSNTLTITITSGLPASVGIAASPGTTICAGTSVTFTATATNGGSTPAYQWQLNSVNVGTNSSTYTNISLADGDVVTCIMTSSESCATGNPATSNTINMAVSAAPAASVSIDANPGTTVCTGTSVTFTATATNGGTTPTYQWLVNSVSVGSNSSTYTNAALANGDVVTCVMTSSESCISGNPATSNILTMTISAAVPASVTIAASPGTTICTGTSVTFTATATNGGSTPAYQWQLNSVNVGTNNSTYTNASLANGDVITCIMTSDAGCVTGNPATSNTLAITINSSLPASITISASPGTTVCTGSSVTFTATAINGGTTPGYQWQVNGSNAGTNSSIFTTSSLINSDQITCIMTSSESCATGSPATSNTLTMTVNSSLPASVNITANPGTTVCAGASVTFTATPTNGGSAPGYQWQVNGSNTGTNSSTFSTSSLSNGDQVLCIMTSNASCATGSPATSNTLAMTVNTALPASVTITANPGTTVCSGTSVTFTATAANGGSTPSYQWQLNGSNTGTNSSTFTTSSLSNSDIITCIMTSNASCVTGSPAISNTLVMTVNSVVSAAVIVTANPGTTVCTGTAVMYTATASNGGTTPAYQWQVNGSNVGSNSSTYTSSSMNNGDQIVCIMTSNASCVTGSPATSNILTMTVSSSLPASVTISANPGTLICSGTNVTFTAIPVNGGTAPSYQWQLNGSNVGSNSSTYVNSSLMNSDQVTCIMTSNESCASGSPATSNTLAITISSALPVSAAVTVSPGTTTCSGDNITFTATSTNGGSVPSYQWLLNGANVGTNSSTYSGSTFTDGDMVSCQVTSDLSCATGNPATSNTLTLTITQPLAVSVSIAANPNTPSCFGTNIDFTASPVNGGAGPSYQWQVNGSNAGSNSSVFSSSSLNDGDVVTVILTSNASCISGNPATSNAVTISVIALPIANAGTDQTLCAGDTVTLTASGGGTYLWSNSASTASTSVNPGSTTTYTVTVTSNGCTASDNIVVTVVPAVVADLGPDEEICEGQNIVITATGGTSYSWSTGTTSSSINVTPSSTTTYTVTISNESCTASDDIVVTVNPAPSADAGADQVICSGNQAVLTATGSGTYLWSTGDTTQSIIVNPLSTTLYTLTISNGLCDATDNVAVSVNPSPTAGFIAIDTTVGTTENVIFSDQSADADSWLWHFGDGTTSTEQNPMHPYNDDGFYTVILVVTNTEGCSDTLTMSDYIHVYGETEIFIPSCFTPNNDSENDVLYVRGINIDNLDFKIYDQWGIIIFESDDVTKGWDGTYNGTPQPVGNYVYRVKVTTLKGDPMSMEGIVTLIR